MTQVVIAGAGPVGLALAVELGTRGVNCVVVEPRARGRAAPRAKLTNVRSMEHLRRWGIAEELRAATPLPAAYSTDIAFVTQLLDGYELARFTNVFNTAPIRDARFAEPAQQVPQYVVEEVLRHRAKACPSVAFAPAGERVERFDQDADGVTVVTTGQTIRAQYLVGCDGGGSTVREQAGIPMHGRRGVARNFSVVFRSNALGQQMTFAPALHFWIVNDRTPAFMGPSDRDGLWWLQATRLPSDVDLGGLNPLALVDGAVGSRPDDVEIVTTDLWEVHELMAGDLRLGRVFLAGDAAHLHSPMGAHGMNQGIGDAVDLGWKLAAVLGGWGGTALLDAYAAERAPFHRRAIEEASLNYATLANELVCPELETPGARGDHVRAETEALIRRAKHREFNSLGLVLGHCYVASPVIVDDGSPPPPDEVASYTPRCRPGMRAPHAWVDPDVSLFDAFGPGFSLLCFDGGASGAPFARAAQARGIPLQVLSVDDPEVAALYHGQAVLVRPDQVVGWCGQDALATDAGAVLDVATGRL
jgi:2-polyprenyl-6-methoxyphenol hydroxylase-like FAD-dependent oxidoreductase